MHSIGYVVHEDADWHFIHFGHLFTFNSFFFFRQYCSHSVYTNTNPQKIFCLKKL